MYVSARTMVLSVFDLKCTYVIEFGEREGSQRGDSVFALRRLVVRSMDWRLEKTGFD